MAGEIDKNFKKIIFSIRPEEQKKYLKMYNYYRNIKSYDYKELENKIYAKQGITDDKRKIEFELRRIRAFFKTNNITDEEFQERFNYIEKAFMVYSEYDDDIGKGDNILNEIINSIISLELDMGMKIGLYAELCDYFESEIINIHKANIKRK